MAIFIQNGAHETCDGVTMCFYHEMPVLNEEEKGLIDLQVPSFK